MILKSSSTLWKAALLGVWLTMAAAPDACAQTLTISTKIVGVNPEVIEETFSRHGVVVGVRRVQEISNAGPDEDPLIIEKEEGEFPDGEYWQYHPSGKSVQFIKPYKNGLKDGLFKEMNPDGSVKLTVTYKEGRKNGPLTIYHPNGRPQLVIPYVDNVREGVQQTYLANGKLDVEDNFKRGEPKPYQKTKYYYDPDQNKRSVHFFDFSTGEGYRKFFRPDGTPAWSVGLKGDQLVDFKKYDTDGWEIESVEGPYNGDVPSYYASGELMQHDHYRNGYPAGFTMYDLRGRVLMKSR